MHVHACGCALSPHFRARSVFEKTYAYVKRMSYANATVETTQSIRECVAAPTLASTARALLCGTAACSHAQHSERRASTCARADGSLLLLCACRALASRGLHEFEVSVLGNLAPSNAEEAKALVPSLDPQQNPEVWPQRSVAAGCTCELMRSSRMHSAAPRCRTKK